MLTLIFGIWASEPPPRAWRTTEKAGPDRVKDLPRITLPESGLRLRGDATEWWITLASFPAQGKSIQEEGWKHLIKVSY